MGLPLLRNRRGQFRRGWHLNDKGYPRYHAGPYRGKYVHRVQMSLALGRPLRPDEDVHHKNGIKHDFRLSNLKIIDHETHGFISSRQRWFMTNKIEAHERWQYEAYGLILSSPEPSHVPF